MRKILTHFTVFTILILLQSSCAMKKYTVEKLTEKLPEKRIVFGNGGGFAGIETEYTLLKNGQLFKKASLTAEYQELDKCKKKIAKGIFKSVEELELEDPNIFKPGNVYHFIHLNSDKYKERMTWGDHGYEVDEKVKNLYYTLVELVNTKK